jgi:hypothetical protein
MKVKTALISLFLLFVIGFMTIIFTGISYRAGENMDDGTTFSLILEVKDDMFVISDPKGFSLIETEIPLSSQEVSLPLRQQPFVSNLKIQNDIEAPDDELLDEASFVFQVKMEGEEVVLNGLKGTRWTLLRFSCTQPCGRKITNKDVFPKPSTRISIGTSGINVESE